MSSVGPRENVSWHVDAFLVLDDEVEVQGQLLYFCKRFAGWEICASLERLVISEEDKFLTVKHQIKLKTRQSIFKTKFLKSRMIFLISV